jgi:hypothetical protein
MPVRACCWVLVISWACQTGDDLQAAERRGSISSVSYRWYDVNGMRVTDGSALVVADASGYFWGIDGETGTPREYAEIYEVFYAEDDCQGDGAIKEAGYYAPRFVLSFLDFDVEDAVDLGHYWVRPDDVGASTAEFCYASILRGTCVPAYLSPSDCLGGDTPWFPAQPLLEVQIPPITFSGPLHPVPVE